MSTQQQRQTMTSGRFNQETHAAASSQSKLTINAKSIRKELSVVSSSQVKTNRVVKSRVSPTFSPQGSHRRGKKELLLFPLFQ